MNEGAEKLEKVCRQCAAGDGDDVTVSYLSVTHTCQSRGAVVDDVGGATTSCRRPRGRDSARVSTVARRHVTLRIRTFTLRFVTSSSCRSLNPRRACMCLVDFHQVCSKDAS